VDEANAVHPLMAFSAKHVNQLGALCCFFCRSLANEVCTVDEAKAVYPFMAIGANIALVAAGCYIRLVNHTLATTVAGEPRDMTLLTAAVAATVVH
jgi:ATP/ADP translocase